MIYVLNFADHRFYTAYSSEEAIRQVRHLMAVYDLDRDDFEIIMLGDEDYGWVRFDFDDFCEKWS